MARTGRMTNIEVARAMVLNAKAYADSGDMETVKANLEYIAKCLDAPLDENQDHLWGDFQ